MKIHNVHKYGHYTVFDEVISLENLNPVKSDPGIVCIDLIRLSFMTRVLRVRVKSKSDSSRDVEYRRIVDSAKFGRFDLLFAKLSGVSGSSSFHQNYSC